jgi:hypothetical protein
VVIELGLRRHAEVNLTTRGHNEGRRAHVRPEKSAEESSCGEMSTMWSFMLVGTAMQSQPDGMGGSAHSQGEDA